MSLRIAVIFVMLSLGAIPVATQAASATQLLAANGMSLDGAIKQVKAQTGGRVLSAETITRDGNRVHRIKVLLPDGTIKVILINAG